MNRSIRTCAVAGTCSAASRLAMHSRSVRTNLLKRSGAFGRNTCVWIAARIISAEVVCAVIRLRDERTKDHSLFRYTDFTSNDCQSSRLTNRVPPYKANRPPRDGLSRIERFATFTTLPYSFEPRSRLFGSHLVRSQAGTTSVRGCYRSRRSLLPYASRRNAPTRAG